jgi:ATP/maltotriose-dependent transcriptional regulator MalT
MAGWPLRAWECLRQIARKKSWLRRCGLCMKAWPSAGHFAAPAAGLARRRRREAQARALTGREQEVLQLLAQGLANKQIATALEISAHTVKFHISSVYGKLGRQPHRGGAAGITAWPDRFVKIAD